MTENYPTRVWANSFGTYYAEIALAEGDTTPDSKLRRIASKAIRKELDGQIGDGYRMKLTYVGMKTLPGSGFVVVYKEL